MSGSAAQRSTAQRSHSLPCHAATASHLLPRQQLRCRELLAHVFIHAPSMHSMHGPGLGIKNIHNTGKQEPLLLALLTELGIAGEHQLTYNRGQPDESYEVADLSEFHDEEIRWAGQGRAGAGGTFWAHFLGMSQGEAPSGKAVRWVRGPRRRVAPRLSRLDLKYSKGKGMHALI